MHKRVAYTSVQPLLYDFHNFRSENLIFNKYLDCRMHLIHLFFFFMVLLSLVMCVKWKESESTFCVCRFLVHKIILSAGFFISIISIKPKSIWLVCMWLLFHIGRNNLKRWNVYVFFYSLCCKLLLVLDENWTKEKKMEWNEKNDNLRKSISEMSGKCHMRTSNIWCKRDTNTLELLPRTWDRNKKKSTKRWRKRRAHCNGM